MEAVRAFCNDTGEAAFLTANDIEACGEAAALEGGEGQPHLGGAEGVVEGVEGVAHALAHGCN